MKVQDSNWFSEIRWQYVDIGKRMFAPVKYGENHEGISRIFFVLTLKDPLPYPPHEDHKIGCLCKLCQPGKISTWTSRESMVCEGRGWRSGYWSSYGFSLPKEIMDSLNRFDETGMDWEYSFDNRNSRISLNLEVSIPGQIQEFGKVMQKLVRIIR